MRFSIATFALAALSSVATLVAGAALETRAIDISANKHAQGTTLQVSTSSAKAGQSLNSLAKGSLNTSAARAANYDVLYGCDGYNFTGNCWYIGITAFGPCFNLPPVVDNRFSSVTELYTNVGCYLYTELNCGGTAGYIQYNTGLIGVLAPPFDKGISSLQCYILF